MNRLREFDFLRAFAALSVIMIHVSAGYVTEDTAWHLVNVAMRYAVPMFIILSGLVLAYSEQGRQPLPYLTFVRKRFGKILIPYVIWTLVYVYYNAREVWRTYGIDGALRIADTLPDHFRLGDGSYHLYFLVVMFQLYLMYPVLRAWMAKHPASLLVVSFVISAVSQTMHYKHHVVFGVHLFPHWLFDFVVGMYMVQKREALTRLLQGRELLMGVIWALSYVLLVVDGKITDTSYTSTKPTVMLYAFTSLFFFYPLALRAKHTVGLIGRTSDWLSTQSFLIFLAHPIVLSLLADQVKKFGHPDLWDGTWMMPVKYVVATLLTVLITYLVSLTPFASLVGGVYSRGKKKKPGTGKKLEKRGPALEA